MASQLESSSATSNLENIRILNRVRLIAINAQLVLILFAVFYLDIKLPLLWLGGLIAIEVLFELYCVYLVKKGQSVSSIELSLHITIDSLIVAGLIYFTGGANNPFIYILLLSVALGSFMLAARYLLFITTLELSLYSLLNIYQRPLELGESSPLASFHLHLAGMWVNFILTVILISIFGLLTRRAMMKQEKRIQSMREKHLQDEQILGLGIMSASAAHELGTPLSTMAIIVDDLRHSDDTQDLVQDMTLLNEQIIKCKKIIGGLNDKSRHAKQQLIEQQNDNEGIQSTNLIEQLNRTIENWLVYRPQIKVEQTIDDSILSKGLRISISLEQAITNLLDNAADASIENDKDIVEISVYLDEANSLIIDLLDFGSGIPETKKSLGIQIQDTNKQDGLGWGVFLSNVSIERAGGRVQLLENKNGGTLTRIIFSEKKENDG